MQELGDTNSYLWRDQKVDYPTKFITKLCSHISTKNE